MIDRERAIRILENERECCNRTCARIECGECDLVMDTDWLKQGLDDAIALLKEQPEVVRCNDCKFYPDGKGTTKWLPCREIIVPPRWFCADGKRKEVK